MNKKKVLGLVLELNPFHKGHVYFIQEAKKIINPDVTIAIISSSFSMRGDAMVMDKWEKSKRCLDYGIDIVLDLPFLSCVTSSDYFCYNAIDALNQAQITDIAFGVETCNLDKLRTMKDLTEGCEFDLLIKEYLSKGHSYSASSLKAILQLSSDEDIQTGFTLPNNTLAIGYLKAIDKINPNIQPHLIKRIDNQYYDTVASQLKLNSATSLRLLLDQGQLLDDHVPIQDYPYFIPSKIKENLFKLCQYVLLTSSAEEMKDFWGMNEGINHRFISMIGKASSYDELISLVQTRRYTANRIQRTILYLLLKIDKSFEYQYQTYLRILSMNQTGVALVNQYPKETKQKLITSFKNKTEKMIEIELRASKLYGVLVGKPSLYLQEYLVPFIGDK